MQNVEMVRDEGFYSHFIDKEMKTQRSQVNS